MGGQENLALNSAHVLGMSARVRHNIAKNWTQIRRKIDLSNAVQE